MSTTFNKSVKGASHIASCKPCQDYSLSYEDSEIIINVVCDGHGGDTYFRSDVGAKLAAEITLGRLKDFAQCIPSETFAGKKFSITAKPKRNPFIDSEGNRIRFNELNEEQQKYARQAQSYIEAKGTFKEQQNCIERLLSSIYEEWKKQIRTDEKLNPFNRNEKKVLGEQGVEKAYGCTLLAFLRTSDYWLSFHIGDGKILSCDSSLSWQMPVPEDCSCFLNFTTSLCDNNPLGEFRYAFNGEGNAPFSVMLCSDGIDGSLRTEENLQDFYEQIIGLFLDGDNVDEELSSYLPTLSENGNKDDISISGYVDLNSVNTEELKKCIEINKKNRDIKSDYRTRKSEIDVIQEKISNLKTKYEKQKDLRFEKQTELDELKQVIESREKQLYTIESFVASIKKEIDDLERDLILKNKNFEVWKFTIKNEMAENEFDINKNVRKDEDINSSKYTNW
jgi:serine/threonine protein phosphatase PrpC